jgi:hypothetical protein
MGMGMVSFIIDFLYAGGAGERDCNRGGWKGRGGGKKKKRGSGTRDIRSSRRLN